MWQFVPWRSEALSLPVWLLLHTVAEVHGRSWRTPLRRLSGILKSSWYRFERLNADRYVQSPVPILKSDCKDTGRLAGPILVGKDLPGWMHRTLYAS